MGRSTAASEVAARLRVSLGLMTRRLRQVPAPTGLTLSEVSALARLDRGGPATGTALAQQERIRPQSMGAILTSLEGRGFVERRPDLHDGRQVVASITPDGTRILNSRRDDKTERLAEILSSDFTPDELALLARAVPLLERLAQSV
jgi:DNA-binding MarR family transcriptional regulator